MNLEFLREYCLSLPAVQEEVKWQSNLCFLVGGKMFCVASLEGPFSASFKVSDEEFEEIIAAGTLSPAPYLARAKWVLATSSSRLARKDWERYIKQSYGLVRAKLPKKIKKHLG